MKKSIKTGIYAVESFDLRMKIQIKCHYGDPSFSWSGVSDIAHWFCHISKNYPNIIK